MKEKPYQTALVLNGMIRDFKWLNKKLSKFKNIIAVDGGLNYCEKGGVIPQIIIGDLDSAKEKLIEKYKNKVSVFQFPSEKDCSDFEIGLEYAKTFGKGAISVFGAEGGRLDHTVSNLLLLTKCNQRIYFETEYASSFLLDKPTPLRVRIGQTLSILPFSYPLPILSTQGLKWDMNELVLSNEMMSLSNICLETEVKLNLHRGKVLVSLIRML